MRVKLLALAFVVTVLALSSQRPAWAVGLCPAYSCYDYNAACANGGGYPALPVNIGETCYTLPTHTVYDIAIASCFDPSTLATDYQECYW